MSESGDTENTQQPNTASGLPSIPPDPERDAAVKILADALAAFLEQRSDPPNRPTFLFFESKETKSRRQRFPNIFSDSGEESPLQRFMIGLRLIAFLSRFSGLTTNSVTNSQTESLCGQAPPAGECWLVTTKAKWKSQVSSMSVGDVLK
jgi:hypothetical protein